MSDGRTSGAAVRAESNYISGSETRTELFRKSIHVLVALVPALASYHLVLTQFLLVSAVLLYSVSELMRQNGRGIVLISGITAAAARERDSGGFVLGPLTLAVGAMLALMLYPLKAAELAIYALAFGDTAASLVGRFFGKIVLPGFGKKTLEGTLACFVAVFVASFAVTSNAAASAVIAAAASLLELVPVKDLDNLLIPVGTGLAAVLVL